MTPNFLRGFSYGTTFKSGCIAFHPCKVTHKCQNYDRHNRHCFLCEQRIRPQKQLGGLIYEGQYYPDVQHAVRVTELSWDRSYFSADNNFQRFQTKEIANRMQEITKAQDMIKWYTESGMLKEYE